MNYTIACFAGPSLSQIHISNYPSFIEFHPPAAGGDILNFLIEKPLVKCIILADGYFFSNYAPLHREIQLALKSNITVIGCSSMGALRASELACDGMQGFGTVYHYFKKHSVTPDDEVGLLHSVSGSDYSHLSIPLINFRIRLLKTRSRRLRTLLQLVIADFEKLPFYERTWTRISKLLNSTSESPDDFTFFRSQYVDYKSLDLYNVLHSLCVEPICSPAQTTISSFDLDSVRNDITSGQFLAGSYVLAPFRKIGVQSSTHHDLSELNLRDLILVFDRFQDLTQLMLYHELLLKEAIIHNISITHSQIETYLANIALTYSVDSILDLCRIYRLAFYELICYTYQILLINTAQRLLARHVLRGINIGLFSTSIRSLSMLPLQDNPLDYQKLSSVVPLLEGISEPRKCEIIQQLISAGLVTQPFEQLQFLNHIPNSCIDNSFKLASHEFSEVYARLDCLCKNNS